MIDYVPLDVPIMLELDSGCTTPPPPYSREDPTYHPGSPKYCVTSPSSPTSGITAIKVLYPGSTADNPIVMGGGTQQIFDRHTGASRVLKRRARVKLEISKYRRRHRTNRTCDHRNRHIACVCGFSADELEQITQKPAPQSTTIPG
jgi:hypothetical protein